MLERVNEMQIALDRHKMSVAKTLSFADQLDVSCRNDAIEAIEYVSKARSISDDIESKKKELLEEAKSYIKQINALTKEFSDPLDKVEEIIVSKIDRWKVEKADMEEEAEVDVEYLMLNEDIFEQFQEDRKLESDTAMAYEKIVYDVRVIDEHLLPREYLIPDTKKIALDVKNGKRKIPGVEIKQKIKTIIKRR